MDDPIKQKYKNMIMMFRSAELKTLLEAFGYNNINRKMKLRDKALELLHNKPADINYLAYCAKIDEIYQIMAMQGANIPFSNSNNNMYQNINMMHGQMVSVNIPPNHQQRIYRFPQYPQQPMQITRNILPQMLRGTSGTPRNSRFQYKRQHSVTRAIMPIQPGIRVQNQMGSYDMNNTISMDNNIVACPRDLTNVHFKILPFYEVVDVIIKPVILSGHDMCTLPTPIENMKECEYNFNLLRDQVNYISLNRNLNCSKGIQFLYQAHVRIGLIDVSKLSLGLHMEVSDFLPIGLNIRVYNQNCLLPPNCNTPRGKVPRRMPKHIHISRYLKLSPIIMNNITLNWIPDGKMYTWGIYLVKKLNSELLLQKLINKGARNSEETKNKIRNILADVDPDLATKSYRVSLMCPLSKMKMQIPAKSTNCNHLQCFDAKTFLLMNEKKPTWSCPTCCEPCLYEDIQIESYFLDIVSNPTLPNSCNEIEILPDGTWKVYEEQEININTDNAANNNLNPIDFINLDDSDDDADDNTNNNPKNKNVTEEIEEPKPKIKRESSFSYNSNLIDLTLSDDEEQTNENNKQGNKAQAADVIQPVTTTVGLKSHAQVQPQQAVTSFEQGETI